MVASRSLRGAQPQMTFLAELARLKAAATKGPPQELIVTMARIGELTVNHADAIEALCKAVDDPCWHEDRSLYIFHVLDARAALDAAGKGEA